jgi:hypothetical protein
VFHGESRQLTQCAMLLLPNCFGSRFGVQTAFLYQANAKFNPIPTSVLQSVIILFSCEDFPRIALLPRSILLVLRLRQGFGGQVVVVLGSNGVQRIWHAGVPVLPIAFGDILRSAERLARSSYSLIISYILTVRSLAFSRISMTDDKFAFLEDFLSLVAAARSLLR